LWGNIAITNGCHSHYGKIKGIEQIFDMSILCRKLKHVDRRTANEHQNAQEGRQGVQIETFAGEYFAK